jgi:inhibitor of cysteine peptidase
MRSRGLILRCAVVATFFVMMRGVVAGQTVVAKGDTSAAGVTVVSGQTGGQVSLKVGAVLEVRLESNHTTGYSWIVAPVGSPVLMRQGAAKYEEHATGGKAGVGGVEIWRFKAMKTGKQGLQFEYRRPWEKDAPAAKIVTYSVTVE